MHALTLNRCVALAALALLAVSSTLASPSDDGTLARHGGARRMTNGERLARGLAPNKPDLRRARTRQQRRGTSATITTTTTASSGATTSSSPAPPPPPTPPCTPGVIKTSTGLAYGNGYLDTGVTTDHDNPNLLVTTDVSEAGIFCLDDGTPGGPRNFEIQNVTPGWPAGLSLALTMPLDAVPEFTNVSFVWGTLELGMTTQPFDTPQTEPPFNATAEGPQYVESAIWYVDPATNIVTAQWVNPDTDVVPLVIQYSGDDIVAGGPGTGIFPEQVLTLEWVPS